MTVHLEKVFEDSICTHLATHNWLYEANSAARYDRELALFPEDLAAWVPQFV